MTLSSEENISHLNSIRYGKFSVSWSFTKRLFLNFGSTLTLHGYPKSLQLLLTSLVLFSARNVFNALSFTSHVCILNHLVWRYVCVLLISIRTGSHRPRKHKKENDCNATSRTPASALVAIFSSSPANFSRALNIFEKRFFDNTYCFSPCAPPNFCYALDTLTSHWSQNFPVMGWWRKNSNKRSTHPKNGIHKKQKPHEHPPNSASDLYKQQIMLFYYFPWYVSEHQYADQPSLQDHNMLALYNFKYHFCVSLIFPKSSFKYSRHLYLLFQWNWEMISQPSLYLHRS